MDEHEGFWKVTEDALDYALASSGIDDPDLRDRLMSLNEELPAYDDVPAVLG